MSIVEMRIESLKMALEIKRDYQTIDDIICIADKIYQYLDGPQN